MLNSLLHGITAHDPVTFVAVTIMLALFLIMASLVPAVRALRVDPVVALRNP